MSRQRKIEQHVGSNPEQLAAQAAQYTAGGKQDTVTCATQEEKDAVLAALKKYKTGGLVAVLTLEEYRARTATTQAYLVSPSSSATPSPKHDPAPARGSRTTFVMSKETSDPATIVNPNHPKVPKLLRGVDVSAKGWDPWNIATPMPRTATTQQKKVREFARWVIRKGFNA